MKASFPSIRTRTCRLPLLFRREGGFFKGCRRC
jgi:hypothetical protein